MFNQRIFDKEIDDLIEQEQNEKGEERMLKEYSALKAAGSLEGLEYAGRM